MTEERLRRVTIGEPSRLGGRVVLADPSPEWPLLFEREEQRIRAALGSVALVVEHVGSTAVPRLEAKPVIDIDLVVTDPADEPRYVPALAEAGYVLHLREPDWCEHRLLRRAVPAVNVHVFPAGCPEVERNILFRNWLRAHDDDRGRYASEKRRLAAQTWDYLQDYADAKTGVIEEILARAGGSAHGGA